MLQRDTVLGFIFAVVTGLCFASASLFIKLCSDIPISLIILARSLLQIISSLALNLCIWREKLNPQGKTRVLCVFAIICFFITYGIYLAFQHKAISLGEIIVILSTCPIFAALMERLILKTPIPRVTTISGAVCTVGAYLLSYSNVSELGGYTYAIGFGVVILATIAQAGTFILIRQLDVHFIIPVLYLGIWNGILCSIVIATELQHFKFEGVPREQWTWLSLVSVFAVTGSYSLNLGLQYENATMVALIRNVDIAIAYVFDVAILRHEFSVMSLIGSTLVIMATIGSGLYNTAKIKRTDYNKLPLEDSKNLDDLFM